MAESVRRALKGLQQQLRGGPAVGADPVAMVVRVPGPATGDGLVEVALTVGQAEAVGVVGAALLADLRFEHLAGIDEWLPGFVGQCQASPSADHVREFMEEYGKEPVREACFFPVEFLVVKSETSVAGVRLLPVDHPDVPPEQPQFPLGSPVGCVAAVEVEGTSLHRMEERARPVVAHALRVLRVALRTGQQAVIKEQVRYRLGTWYAFSERAGGWKLRDDVAFGVDLPEDLGSLLGEQPVLGLPAHPSSRIEKKADVALKWMERAYLSGEPLVVMLYLFFALEGLLGDTAEKLKSYPLAFREMMLSHVATGGFRNPDETLLLYGEVRSGAVHGEEVREVTWDDAMRFEWVVRDALQNYLAVARAQGLSNRGDLLRFLDDHDDRPDLIAWLRANGRPSWSDYLDELEGSGS